MQKWKAEEVEILKEIYKQGDLSLLKEYLPNRTYSSCTTKARKMGLKVRELWSDEELNILKNNYSLCSMEEMVKMLPKRNRKTIEQRACELKIRNVCKFQDWETQYIMDNYQTMTDKEIANKLGRDWHTILDKRYRMGLIKEHPRTCYDDIYEYLRRNNNEWKIMSMRQCNYKCVITGNRFDEIHHIYGFNKIVDKTLDYLNIDKNVIISEIDESLLFLILETFRDIQSRYPLGVCLTKEVHTKFHALYGYGNNTIEQWNDFVSKN